MFKVMSLAEYNGEIERFDADHVPPIFNVRVGPRDRHSEPAAVWRVEPLRGAFAESSLLQVWVRRSDGTVRDIECISLQKEWIEFVNDEFNFLGDGDPGLPAVDMTLWEGLDVQSWEGGIWPAIVERMPLRLFVGREAYSVRIGEATDITEVIACDRFRFGLDHERNLRRIDVLDVNPEKIQAIREYRESPPSGIPPAKGGLTRLLQWETSMLLRRLRWQWLRWRSP